MKKAIKERLKKYPLVFSALQNVYHLFPQPTVQGMVKRGLKRNPMVFFVQVGSNDGLHGDPLHDLIVENKRWAGIFIEPISFLFKRLRSNYGGDDRFAFENVAIGTERGTRKFYYIGEGTQDAFGGQLPPWHEQLGSFDRQHILTYLGDEFEQYIVEENIECLPLSEVLARNNVERIDLLHIDTEGFDYKVLSQLDFDMYRPSVILYEHKHLSDEEKEKAKSLLKDSGYRLTECDCGDTVAVSKKLATAEHAWRRRWPAARR